MQKQILAMLLIIMFMPSSLACQTSDIPLAPALSSSTCDNNVTIYDFNSNCTSGSAPLHTDFSCNVSGNVTAYCWVFSPVCSDYFSRHAGLYNITLTVVEANGQKASMTKTGYINVTGYTQVPKSCNATTSKTCTPYKSSCTKTVCKTITMKGKGFCTKNIKNVTWTYGDGTKYTSKCLCVKHTFHKAGKCSVCTIVVYNNGQVCRGNTTVMV